MDWKPWNEALAMIALVADYDIVEVAQAIDAQIWPVHQQIKRGWRPDGGWFSMRDAIETRRQDFVNIARQRLAAPGPPLRRLSGRPAADDPFWEFRRSYFLPASRGEEKPPAGAGSPAQDATAAPSQTPGPGCQ